MDFAIEPLAENALLLRFGDGIDATINARVHAAARALRAVNLPGVIDIAPAYATLLVRFNAFVRDGDALSEAITRALCRRFRGGDGLTAAVSGNPAAQRVEIPVCYEGGFGQDLEAVAEYAQLSRQEVIARHTAAEYTVAMLGFAPGFPYLLGLDAALHVPRRADPRTRVPAGSVAIGGAQTGIYPRELPGGWNLIGRTPLALFDPDRAPPCLLAPGDRVWFRAIDADEFAQHAERRA
ncbi:MAG TPA: 5-oxoprolinase subunit PxpB [Rhodanobacteraceae bacterium]|nr:5-oxoprolinase subunit PxpB [Rhodanobacteraceae bacterium]